MAADVAAVLQKSLLFMADIGNPPLVTQPQRLKPPWIIADLTARLEAAPLQGNSPTSCSVGSILQPLRGFVAQTTLKFPSFSALRMDIFLRQIRVIHFHRGAVPGEFLAR